MTIGEKLSASVAPFIGQKMTGGQQETVAAHARDIDRAIAPLVDALKVLLSLADNKTEYGKKAAEKAAQAIKYATGTT